MSHGVAKVDLTMCAWFGSSRKTRLTYSNMAIWFKTKNESHASSKVSATQGHNTHVEGGSRFYRLPHLAVLRKKSSLGCFQQFLYPSPAPPNNFSLAALLGLSSHGLVRFSLFRKTRFRNQFFLKLWNSAGIFDMLFWKGSCTFTLNCWNRNTTFKLLHYDN